MNRGVRHKVQRDRRKMLKADCVLLLDRIAAMTELPPFLVAEVAEMRLRLAPPPGVKATIVRTGYTRRKA